jgi:hypothetical protein
VSTTLFDGVVKEGTKATRENMVRELNQESFIEFKGKRILRTERKKGRNTEWRRREGE